MTLLVALVNFLPLKVTGQIALDRTAVRSSQGYSEETEVN